MTSLRLFVLALFGAVAVSAAAVVVADENENGINAAFGLPDFLGGSVFDEGLGLEAAGSDDVDFNQIEVVPRGGGDDVHRDLGVRACKRRCNRRFKFLCLPTCQIIQRRRDRLICQSICKDRKFNVRGIYVVASAGWNIAE